MLDEDGLTPADRELETALRSLRPTPAPFNPAATARLVGRSTPRINSRRWQAAAAAAAIVLGSAWLVSRPSGPVDSIDGDAPITGADATAFAKAPSETPTLLTYRQALDRSPAQFEDLLDRQATTPSGSQTETLQISGLTLWNVTLHPSQGAM